MPDQYEYSAINSLNGETPQTLTSSGNGTAGLPIDPVALAYLKLFPAPNTPGCNVSTPSPSANCLTNNYVISPNKTQSGNSFDVRIDHRFNDTNTFFGRYDYNKFNTFKPPGLGTVNGLQISGGRYDFDGPATDTAQQYGFGFTHIFNVQLRAGSACCLRPHQQLLCPAELWHQPNKVKDALLQSIRAVLDPQLCAIGALTS